MTEVILYRDFEYFYCPITGQQILQPDDYDPSPATAFIFYHPERSFEYMSEALQEEYSELFKDTTRHGELYLKLTEEDLKETDNLWITFSDRAIAVSWCFNTGFEVQEEE